jgi:hypothetical protein
VGDDEILRMMQGYAQQAVELAQQHKVDLDFSENSLQSLELLLSQIGITSGDAPGASGLDEMSRIWGGYFGEVVRRRFGGDWTVEKYPQGDFHIVTLNVNGARLFPSMKIHRRLTQGAGEDLWSFYQSVRTKLLSQPGAKVQ